MKKIRKALWTCIQVLCVLAFFAGPARAALIVDGDFNASADSVALRDDGPGQDWYESRADVPTLLTLNTAGIGGNSTNMAALLNYGVAGNAYLTQEFDSPQTGQFRVGFDIYIDRIENNSSYPNYDRTGLVYIGNESSDTGTVPTSGSNERFVFLAFYDSTPGTSGDDMQLRARTSSTQSYATTSAWTPVYSGMSYDTWYSIMLEIDVPNRNYDVYINNVLQGDDIAAYSGYPTSTPLEYLTFSADSEGRGDFYVDNVVPIPGAVWLLGSGMLGLVVVRRRDKKVI